MDCYTDSSHLLLLDILSYLDKMHLGKTLLELENPNTAIGPILCEPFDYQL